MKLLSLVVLLQLYCNPSNPLPIRHICGCSTTSTRSGDGNTCTTTPTASGSPCFYGVDGLAYNPVSQSLIIAEGSGGTSIRTMPVSTRVISTLVSGDSNPGAMVYYRLMLYFSSGGPGWVNPNVTKVYSWVTSSVSVYAGGGANILSDGGNLLRTDVNLTYIPSGYGTVTTSLSKYVVICTQEPAIFLVSLLTDVVVRVLSLSRTAWSMAEYRGYGFIPQGNCIVQFSLSSWTQLDSLGNCSAPTSSMNTPSMIVIDCLYRRSFYFSDLGLNKIQQYSFITKSFETFAGTGTAGSSLGTSTFIDTLASNLNVPDGMTYGGGRLYIGSSGVGNVYGVDMDHRVACMTRTRTETKVLKPSLTLTISDNEVKTDVGSNTQDATMTITGTPDDGRVGSETYNNGRSYEVTMDNTQSYKKQLLRSATETQEKARTLTSSYSLQPPPVLRIQGGPLVIDGTALLDNTLPRPVLVISIQEAQWRDLRNLSSAEIVTTINGMFEYFPDNTLSTIALLTSGRITFTSRTVLTLELGIDPSFYAPTGIVFPLGPFRKLLSRSSVEPRFIPSNATILTITRPFVPTWTQISTVSAMTSTGAILSAAINPLGAASIQTLAAMSSQCTHMASRRSLASIQWVLSPLSAVGSPTLLASTPYGNGVMWNLVLLGGVAALQATAMVLVMACNQPYAEYAAAAAGTAFPNLLLTTAIVLFQGLLSHACYVLINGNDEGSGIVVVSGVVIAVTPICILGFVYYILQYQVIHKTTAYYHLPSKPGMKLFFPRGVWSPQHLCLRYGVAFESYTLERKYTQLFVLFVLASVPLVSRSPTTTDWCKFQLSTNFVLLFSLGVYHLFGMPHRVVVSNVLKGLGYVVQSFLPLFTVSAAEGDPWISDGCLWVILLHSGFTMTDSIWLVICSLWERTSDAFYVNAFPAYATNVNARDGDEGPSPGNIQEMLGAPFLRTGGGPAGHVIPLSHAVPLGMETLGASPHHRDVWNANNTISMYNPMK